MLFSKHQLASALSVMLSSAPLLACSLNSFHWVLNSRQISKASNKSFRRFFSPLHAVLRYMSTEKHEQVCSTHMRALMSRPVRRAFTLHTRHRASDSSSISCITRMFHIFAEAEGGQRFSVPITGVQSLSDKTDTTGKP